MKDGLSDIEGWLRAGQRVAVARVVEVIGSGPRLAGAVVAVAGSGEVAGSAAGGCLEGAIVDRASTLLEAASALPRTASTLVETGRVARLFSFGPEGEGDFSTGLSCGGSTEVFVEVIEPHEVTVPGAVLAELAGTLNANRSVALVEVIAGPARLVAHKALVYETSSSCWLPGCRPELAAAVAGDAPLTAAVVLCAGGGQRFSGPGGDHKLLAPFRDRAPGELGCGQRSRRGPRRHRGGYRCRRPEPGPGRRRGLGAQGRPVRTAHLRRRRAPGRDRDPRPPHADPGQFANGDGRFCPGRGRTSRRHRGQRVGRGPGDWSGGRHFQRRAGRHGDIGDRPALSRERVLRALQKAGYIGTAASEAESTTPGTGGSSHNPLAQK